MSSPSALVDQIERTLSEGLQGPSREDIAELAACARDLLENGIPGVMHEIDRAFYDIAIMERNYERQRNERLEHLTNLQRETIEKLRAAS